MHFTRQSLTTLIDLVENKLSCMEVWDRDDRREAQLLKCCLDELQSAESETGNGVASYSNSVPRRGRRRKVAMAH